MGWEKSTPKHGQIYLIPNLGDWTAQQILAPPHSSVYLSSVGCGSGGATPTLCVGPRRLQQASSSSPYTSTWWPDSTSSSLGRPVRHLWLFLICTRADQPFSKSRIPAGAVEWDCFLHGKGPGLILCACLCALPHWCPWHLFSASICFNLCLITMWFPLEEPNTWWEKLPCTKPLVLAYNCLNACEGN